MKTFYHNSFAIHCQHTGFPICVVLNLLDYKENNLCNAFLCRKSRYYIIYNIPHSFANKHGYDSSILYLSSSMRGLSESSKTNEKLCKFCQQCLNKI